MGTRSLQSWELEGSGAGPGARLSPVAVVGELIVAGEGDQHPEADAQREAHLGGGIYPDLRRAEGREGALRRAEGRERGKRGSGEVAVTGNHAKDRHRGPWNRAELKHDIVTNSKSQRPHDRRQMPSLGITLPCRWPESPACKGAVS